MVYVYIAAAIVVALLIGFVALSVSMVAQRVTMSIRERASELLSAYDGLIEKKSQELRKLNAAVASRKAMLEEGSEDTDALAGAMASQESTVQDNSGFLDVAEKLSSSTYVDPRVGGVYKKIRQSFNFDPMTVIRELVPDLGAEGPATRLLKQLDFDLVQKLSALDEKDQLEALDAGLDGEGHMLLADYMAQTKKFRAIGFYDYLKSRALTEPQPVVLRVPSTADDIYVPEEVIVEIDDDICEGFEIEANNQLYDYCIRKSEIS